MDISLCFWELMRISAWPSGRGSSHRMTLVGLGAPVQGVPDDQLPNVGAAGEGLIR
uniref:Uncharacterized protein n=1 Tax=Anguilla anguilla TaxID=7936 RepID=A0A0E9PIB4_ANGAN